ncbi:theronine dehydrogenase [Salmonella enterica]
MKWRYSLRWRLPRTPCPGPQELVSEVVEAGKPAPESVMARWVAGAGYAVCVDFLDERQIRRWSDERKAAARRRNLERRVNRIAPLFADEFIRRELDARPAYFQGKYHEYASQRRGAMLKVMSRMVRQRIYIC